MTGPLRALAGLLFLAIEIAAGVAMLRSGLYGLTMFVLFPVFLGAIATWVVRPATASKALATGAIAATFSVFAPLLLGFEGLVCIAMALPLAVPLGALGGWLSWRAESSPLATRGNIALLLVIPSGSLTWDVRAKPPVFEVRTAIAIAAPPERVWRNVVAFPPLREPQEWFFRAGIAYPIGARIEGTGVGAVRYCEFSTGPFVEPIEIWDEPRLLRFRVTANPAPLREWSPWAEISPKHLNGYMVSKQGQFLLTPLPGNRTLLEGTTRYQHGLWPATYWRWWSDAIIHRIHLRVLNHIRELSEDTSVLSVTVPQYSR